MFDFLFKSACERKGHTLPPGYSKDGKPYLTAYSGGVDGMGTQHVRLCARCWVCDKEFHVANIHASQDGKLFFSKKD